MKINPILTLFLLVMNAPLAGAQTLEAEAGYVMQVIEPGCVPTSRRYNAGQEEPFLISASDAAKCFYRISVIGGKGDDDATKKGGLGGVFVFDFHPTEAGILTFLVGENGSDTLPAPGGGASAVMFNSTLLAVSGGGGGGSYGYGSLGGANTYKGSNGGPISAENLCSDGGCPTSSGAVTNVTFGITAGGTGQFASAGAGGCIVVQGRGGNGGSGYPGGNGGTVWISPNTCSSRNIFAYGGMGGKGYIASLPSMNNFKFTSTVIEGVPAIGDFGTVFIERMAKP